MKKALICSIFALIVATAGPAIARRLQLAGQAFAGKALGSSTAIDAVMATVCAV